MLLERLIDSDRSRDDWGGPDRRVKPALLTLLSDQAALFDAESWADDDSGTSLDYDLRTGFPDRRSVIEWYQRAVVRTIGNIADVWEPVDIIRDETLMSALVRKQTDGIDPMPPGKAVAWRSQLEENVVMPACNQGYRDLRKMAADYIRSPSEEERKDINTETDLDPRRQKHLAMRPGFQSLDEQQSETLTYLWNGFESYEEMLDWFQALNSPTMGEIEPTFDSIVMGDDTAMQHLLSEPETPEAHVYQELLATTQLLPAFVAGVNVIDTQELAKATQGAPMTLRQKGGHHNE